jgi:hypothetical protein
VARDVVAAEDPGFDDLSVYRLSSGPPGFAARARADRAALRAIVT